MRFISMFNLMLPTLTHFNSLDKEETPPPLSHSLKLFKETETRVMRAVLQMKAQISPSGVVRAFHSNFHLYARTGLPLTHSVPVA